MSSQPTKVLDSGGRSGDAGLWMFAFGVAALFALNNLLLLPAVSWLGPHESTMLLVMPGCGCIGAQGGLLAILLVFGPGPAWERSLFTFSTGLIWAAFWLAGAFVSDQATAGDLRVLTGLALCVPLVFLCVQIPLWPAAVFFRWRIARTSPDSRERSSQMSIAGILAATAVVGIAIALVRVGRWASSSPEEDWWFGIGIAALVAGGIGLAVALPFTFFALRLPSIGVLLIGLWSFAIYMAIMVIGTMMAGGPPGEAIVGIALLIAGFSASLTVPLLLLRIWNYRLLWGSEGQNHLAPAPRPAPAVSN